MWLILYHVLLSSVGSWCFFFRELIGGDAALAMISSLITRKTYQSLFDFDNHLDDITLDWLNITTNKLVEMIPS